MSSRARPLFVLALFIPAALLLLLASIGSLRSERNQRADDLAQRRLGDEERWWLAARDTLSRRINQRADELMAWPL
ncbi:MAG: hypothetical protein V3W41_02290, partial [Planctomycetota bacterium]